MKTNLNRKGYGLLFSFMLLAGAGGVLMPLTTSLLAMRKTTL